VGESSSEPDWSLLPHQPEAFFELQDDYDRKDLKRRYNRLLKQYKPEKFPEEFQRIRAAFEQLDNQLRYGRRMNGPSLTLPNLDWEQGEQAPTAASREGGSTSESSYQKQPPPQPRLWERLEESSPQLLLSELKQKQQKSPFDYYAIAILSDTEADREETTFLKWILKGVSEHPQDPALFRILYQLLREDFSSKMCRVLVKSVANVISDDRFYMLTEPLWDKLLLSEEFPKLAKLLEQCESKLKDYRVNGQVAFYMHFLKKAIFRSSNTWLDRAFHFIEDHHDALSGQSEAELEVLQALRTYRELRNEFLDGNELFTALDQVILDYCELEDFRAEKTFLNLQVQIASAEWDVLEAFPVELDPAMEAFFECWLWIDADIASRFGIEEVEIGSNLKRRSVSILNLMRTIGLRTKKSWIGWFWQSLGWMYEVTRFAASAVMIAFCCMTYAILTRQLSSALYVTGFAVIIVGGIFVGRWLGNKWLLPYFQKLYISYAEKTYDRIWRDQLELYVRQTALPYHVVIKLIHAISEEGDNLSESIIRVGYSDVGLGTLAIAMKYLS
jgi:hypothetical protein